MGSLVKNDSVASTITTIAFDDLTPCSYYTFRVSATTTSEGPFTEDLKNATDIEGTFLTKLTKLAKSRIKCHSFEACAFNVVLKYP